MANLGCPRRSGTALAVLLVAAAIAAGGCETSSTTLTGPAPVKCQVSVSTPELLEAAGGNSSVAVTAQPECEWTASTTASWISGLSPASGQGAGTVGFRAAANDGTSAREGTIVINGEQTRVSQRAPCRYVLTPANQMVAPSGGQTSVAVSTLSECAWTATADVGWISLTSPAGGSGNGTITFTVAPSPAPERTGSIIVAGQRANVTQVAVAAPQPGCTYSISPTSQNPPAAGGPGTVNVTTTTSCAWTAVSHASWVTVTAGASGSGNGPVGFTVAANTGIARTGTLTIAGQTFTVSQAAAAAPCAYSIAPTSQNVDAGANAGTVTVTTAVGCTWTAISNAAWITVTTGAAGAGNGSVGFTAAANTGVARTGTLTIADQTFTLSQAAAVAPCTYSISPTSQNVDAGANTGTVTVTTAAGCTWTASSNAVWITVTSGGAGTGNGSVGFSAAANTGAARTGTVTIAGQVFTVTQAAFVAPCAYSISPTSQNVPALGGSGTVTVTTTSGCAWTASSNAPWITVTSGATGTGNGSVGFSVPVNLLGSRTGTVTIAGQTFTVTQD